MSRLSGPARKRNYLRLLERDGEVCFVGGETLTFQTAVVDHWDNDNTNNREANLHLLCRAMNSVKNPRGRAVIRRKPDPDELLSSMHVGRIRVGMLGGPDGLRIQSAEYHKHVNTAPNFRHWLFYLIVHLSEVEYDQVVASGSELVRCHAQTTKQYVASMTSPAGLYELVRSEDGGTTTIRLKEKWSGFRSVNKQKAELFHQVINWQDDPIERGKKKLEKMQEQGKVISLN
jgi:hypothetical protein